MDDMSTESKRPIHPLRLLFLKGAFFLVISLTAGFAGGWLASDAKRGIDTDTGRQIVSTESELISQIAKDVGSSVVSIQVVGPETQGLFGPQQVQGAGTGFVVSDDGVIVTNRHVIPADASQVSIVLADGTELTDVEVIGRTNEGDPLDIAFLKVKDVQGKELKSVALGDSGQTEVGERVVAIGNALGQFQNTVTTGIISGYGRDVEASDGFRTETLQNLFQTDAAINRGNSGGPLVNANSEVIGVNTAVAGEGAENIGFAIPIDDVKGLIRSVLETGRLERPYLGVRYVNLTDDIAFDYDLDVTRGAYIVSGRSGQPAILPDSPADKAGLKEEDVITKVNNDAINERSSLISLIGKYQVGDEVTLTIMRDGKEQTVNVKLDATPNQ